MGTFQYRFLPADGVMDAVALRFRTTTPVIFALTRDAPAFEGKASVDTDNSSSWRPPYNAFVVVPIPPDDLSPDIEWREVPSTMRTATTLTGLMSDLANRGQLGVSNTPIECEDIYHDWRNRDYREAVSLRQKSGSANDLVVPGMVAAYTEASADVADIVPADTLYLPLAQQVAQLFPVAPSADLQSSAPPATIDLSQNDVRELQTRLRAIELACYNLAGLRRRAQQIQADCHKDIRHLLMARALVQVVTNRYAASARLNDAEGNAGRNRLLAALDDLIAKASQCMLHAPQDTVDPKLSARWTQVTGYLQSLLKDAPTLGLLDRVLPTQGALPYKPSQSSDKRTLVDAVCEIASHAALWLADGPPSQDTQTLLEAAIAAMQGGTPMSSSSAASLLDYVAALSFVKEDHSASGRTAPAAACGVMVNVYAASAIVESAETGTEQSDAPSLKTKLEGAVKALVLKEALDAIGLKKPSDLATYVTLTGRLDPSDAPPTPFGELAAQEKEVEEKQQLASELAASRVTTHVEDALALADKGDDDAAWTEAVRAVKTGGNEEVAAIYKKLRRFEDPQEEFQSLPGRLGQLSKIFKLATSLSARPPAPTSDGPDDGSTPPAWKTAATNTQTVADATRESFESLKKLGILTEASSRTTTAVLGRVSLLLGVVQEGSEAPVAIEGGAYLSAMSHGLQGAGELLLILGPETGGLTIGIGVTLIVAGLALDSPKTLKEFVTSRSEELFNEYMDRFQKGNASYFAQLREPTKLLLSSVQTQHQVDLPPLNDFDLEAYGKDLYTAGFTQNEL